MIPRRIAVANLCPRVRVNESVYFLGLLNRRKLVEEGERVYGAVGGAAMLTEAAIDFLKAHFNAKIERPPDACFTVDIHDIDNILDLLERRDASLCEVDPTREMREELTTTELPGMPPVLTNEDVERIAVCYDKSVLQANPEDDLRASGKQGEPPTRRFFHLFEMNVTEDVFAKLRAHPAVKIFTAEDVATTQGGLIRGVAQDGSIIGTNLFW